ncbi:MAG: hypothetical protein AABZ12_12465 [Planctomycetota bacterium]
MIEYVFISVLGPRRTVENFRKKVELSEAIVDRPGGSTIDFELVAGSCKHRLAEELITEYKLDPFRRRRVEATPEEMATEPWFSCYACHTTDDQYKIVAKPEFSGRDACPRCGRGGTDLVSPLLVHTKKLKKAQLVWVPPGLFLASKALAAAIREKRWSGVSFAPILERSTKSPTGVFEQLRITSVLSPMDSSTEIVPNGIPDRCEVCRRIGFRRLGWQVPYQRSAIAGAADLNLSAEWLAPHAVSFPELICNRQVVQGLLELEPTQKWIPVKLVD